MRPYKDDKVTKKLENLINQLSASEHIALAEQIERLYAVEYISKDEGLKMNSHDRVLDHMNKGKEPKGHCEAMTNRNNNGISVAKKEIERDLSKQGEKDVHSNT